MADDDRLSDDEYERAILMARHVVGPGNAARERLRKFAEERGTTVEALTGTSDEVWRETLRLATEAIEEHEKNPRR